jgi:hypothetical protein
MNETGLVIGMAAVPERMSVFDPTKDSVDSLLVIRRILDEAATVDDAVSILGSYNIDWGGGPPLHYLVADSQGRTALVEFQEEGMVVIPGIEAWNSATNFLLSDRADTPDNMCWRYQLITNRLTENKGILSDQQAMNLLEEVAQPNTQWSVVYGISSGEIQLVLDRDFSHSHDFTLKHTH